LLGLVGAVRRVHHQEVVLDLAGANKGLVTGGLVLATEGGRRTIGMTAGKGIMHICLLLCSSIVQMSSAISTLAAENCSISGCLLLLLTDCTSCLLQTYYIPGRRSKNSGVAKGA